MIEENYRIQGGRLERSVRINGGNESISAVEVESDQLDRSRPLSHAWWQRVIRGERQLLEEKSELGIADLFASVGGLSVGAGLAASAVGYKANYRLAVDLDSDALEVYQRNLQPDQILNTDVGSLTDFTFFGRGESASLAYDPEVVEQAVSRHVGKIDLLLAGPPCQGHSNLNNHTRREDPRNQLYLNAVATALALKAKMIVIENVPEVVRDKSQVVRTCQAILEQSGYHVTQSVVSASKIGGAQTRRRHFLIATLNKHTPLSESVKAFLQESMTLREAIGDLEHTVVDTDYMNSISVLSEENRQRIGFLFDNDLYDLPDHIRPLSHRGGHTYPSVYGRLHWDRPAQTITTGFMSPGRGRYIHPSQPRVLTPREAARIQGFPDTFSFDLVDRTPTRKQLSKWIGDAVPTILGYVAVLTALTGYTEPDREGRSPLDVQDAISIS